MKKAMFTIIVVFSAFSLMGQSGDGLQIITEGGNTGWRLFGFDPTNYGEIGDNAVDLSISNISSSTRGATGAYSTAMGFETTASGLNSTAMGYQTTASGRYSTAMGVQTTASENYSTAMGLGTNASGYGTTAMGLGSNASGYGTTAIGLGTNASGYGTTAIGIYNTIDNNANSTSFDLSNRALVVGNGPSSINLSDALTVLFDGTTTIAGSVTAPAFIGNGSSLTNLPVVGLDQITEGANTGWRLAGSSSPNYGNIGSKAVDLSISISPSSIRGATGNNSTAMGYETRASGSYSFAIGRETTAAGSYSFAMGQSTEASGPYSTAIGLRSMAVGFSSTAMGLGTNALGYGTTAIGTNNTINSNANTSSFDLSNKALVIGNGPNSSNRSDAFTVYFDGTATLAGDLTVHSDRRLKTNISSLGKTLASLRLLDGKKYNMKRDQKQGKIGLLAQDVQKVFPELVKVSADGSETLSLNYQGLIPVLINAVNEQQEVIDTQNTKLEHQEKRINEQQKEIEQLKAMMAKILDSQE